MSDKIIRFDDAMFESKPDALVRVKVEQTINAMLDAEADEIANAARYERETDRKAFRAGHYERTLAAKAGKLSLKAPELKGALFGSAVIERCRRRESSVEEALMEMCLAGVSTRGVDDISRLLWGERMPSRTLSDKLKKIYKEIDEKTANPPWPRQGRSRAKWRNASSGRPRTACARASARPPPASCRGSPRTMGSSCARTT